MRSSVRSRGCGWHPGVDFPRVYHGQMPTVAIAVRLEEEEESIREETSCTPRQEEIRKLADEETGTSVRGWAMSADCDQRGTLASLKFFLPQKALKQRSRPIVCQFCHPVYHATSRHQRYVVQVCCLGVYTEWGGTYRAAENRRWCWSGSSR